MHNTGLLPASWRVTMTSGKHTHRQCHLPATEQERAAWALAFRADGHTSWAEWAREVMNARAEMFGFKAAEKVGVQDDEE